MMNPVRFWLGCKGGSTGTLAFPAFDFAGLLIMTAVPKLFHRTFFVHLLLQTTQNTLDRLVFTAFDL